ncbi:MAG: F0F1 ATP synthase subunit A [Candidatus Uhrbacteria bacterium]|nr:F0F1 ATP synthase subunit A [Candidatus Uhrbacteria bacterium]
MINIPVAAETVFSLGSLPVSNTLINAFLALIVFCVAGLLLRGNLKEVPSGLQNFAEMILEFLLTFFDQVTGDREKSKRFFPIAGTLFLFILLCNWMGLLPGTGSIGVWHIVHGERELVPLLRSANSDLNLTLAMALISVIGAHIVGIVTLGFWTHGNKFIQLGSLWQAVKTLKPIAILTACVEFLVGIIEIFSEFAKIASLSLRLFGNIFAGEVLLTVIAGLVAYLVPLPFMAIEMIVGIVQATVFSMLTLVYLTMMSSQPHGAKAHD